LENTHLIGSIIFVGTVFGKETMGKATGLAAASPCDTGFLHGRELSMVAAPIALLYNHNQQINTKF
jgi:hypothetical protein